MRARKDRIARLVEPLFDLLCAFAEKGKRCPSTMRLREELGCGARSVDEALSSLSDQGKIECVNRGGGGRIVTILVGLHAGKSTSATHIYYPRDVGNNVERDDDLMNYGKGFGPDTDPGDGGPLLVSRPANALALSVAGRYL